MNNMQEKLKPKGTVPATVDLSHKQVLKPGEFVQAIETNATLDPDAEVDTPYGLIPVDQVLERTTPKPKSESTPGSWA
jgi:hypothetical protein